MEIKEVKDFKEKLEMLTIKDMRNHMLLEELSDVKLLLEDLFKMCNKDLYLRRLKHEAKKRD